MPSRRKLGPPPDWTILGLQFFVLGVVVGLSYALAVWGVNAVWKPMESQSSSDFGLAGVGTRQPDGRFSFRPINNSLLSKRGDLNADSPDTTIVSYSIQERIERRPWDPWSASRRVVSLRFYAPDHWTGVNGSLTLDEELQVLRTFQGDQPESLPPLLRHATSLRASGTISQSVYHNAARGVVTLLAIIVFVYGSWRIIRVERNFRRWYNRRCEACGYSLRDIRGDRCPECGRRWWPYGDDLANN